MMPARPLPRGPRAPRGRRDATRHRLCRRRARAQTDVVEMPGREGFGYAVRQGLLYRNSQYVMVVQHDRPFARGFDLGGLLDAMDAEPKTVKSVTAVTPVTARCSALRLLRSSPPVILLCSQRGPRSARRTAAWRRCRARRRGRGAPPT
jgi:hypothetical protein